MFLATILAIITNSLGAVIGLIIGGIFIDIDHFLDYWLEYGFSLNFRKIYNRFLNPKFKRIIVPLHSIDLLFIALSVLIFLPTNIFISSIMLGMITHIIADELTVEKRPFGYFFFYRLYHRFDSKCFFKNNQGV